MKNFIFCIFIFAVVPFVDLFSQEKDFFFSEDLSLKEKSNEVIFKNAVNWYLGARRTSKVEKVLSETGVLESNRSVYLLEDESGFIQIGLDIAVTKPHLTSVSFTVKIETMDNGYSYTIENFYYKLVANKKGQCYQYIPIEQIPPSSCKTTWGLAFYKNANRNIREITQAYITESLIPQLKEWMIK